MATTILRWQAGTLTPALNTGLSFASNALALSGQIAWSDVDYLAAEVEFAGQFAVAPTAGTALAVWFLRSLDGVNYEDGSDTVTPARAPDCVLPFRAVTTAQRVVRRCALPPGAVEVLVKNDGSGQTVSAGWTLAVRPLTQRGVGV